MPGFFGVYSELGPYADSVAHTEEFMEKYIGEEVNLSACYIKSFAEPQVKREPIPELPLEFPNGGVFGWKLVWVLVWGRGWRLYLYWSDTKENPVFPWSCEQTARVDIFGKPMPDTRIGGFKYRVEVSGWRFNQDEICQLFVIGMFKNGNTVLLKNAGETYSGRLGWNGNKKANHLAKALYMDSIRQCNKNRALKINQYRNEMIAFCTKLFVL